MVLFDDALATVVAETTDTHPGGDHTIVVGAVVSLATPSDGAPLIYHDAAYRTL